MSDKLRIVIADCHEIVREGIATRLITDCDADVVGQASDGYTAIKICRNLTPDVLLLDLSITRPSGTETLAKLRSSMPNLKIVVMSSEATTTEAFTILAQGAVCFMPKQAKGADFVHAVQAAATDFTFIPTSYLKEFVRLRQNVTRTGNMYGLSPREVEILEACAAGQKTKEVAERLSISVRTVETHRNSIYRKTDCRSISELSGIAAKL